MKYKEICIGTRVKKKKEILHYRDDRRKKREGDNQPSLPSFVSDLPLSRSSRLLSSSFNLPGILSDIIALTESARACRTYACTLGNDEDGPSRHAGRPSWLMSSRAPSTQPRNADFLVAIVCFTFLFYFFLYFFLLLFYSLLPHLSSVECASSAASRSLSSPYTHRRRQSCADVRVSVTKRSETPSTRGTCKMAEFNGKAPIRAIRRSDYGYYEERRFTDSYRSFLPLL